MPSNLTVVFVSLLLATPAVIFWLWLVIVPPRVAMLCPEGCRCDTGGYKVTCYRTSLNAIPLIHLTQVRIIMFNKNEITLLEKNSFVSLTELEELRMWECGLRIIELGAFNGLTELTKLDMWNNEISEITPGTFDNMNSLEYLDLKNNRLEHLDSEVFRGLFNLKEINLRVNKLRYVHPDTFLGLPKFQHLYLDINRYLQVPTDRNFINSHSLSRLDISDCNLRSVSFETFANVSALKILVLSQNNLRTVDINIFRALPKLSTLLLNGNPLHCDCQLQEVWRWFKERNIWKVNAKCNTPREVKGMWWGVLEKGQCLEGYIQYYGEYNSTSYNYTNTDKKYEFDFGFFKQYQVPLFAFPFIFGTICNVILLIIILCNKDMRTVPNMYILNLAISDIIYLTVLFSEACANKISNTWLNGDFLCTFLPFCRRLSVGLSAYSVAVYSFQRYRVTMNPLQVHISSPPTWRVIVAIICGVWILAALFAVPSALSKHLCEELYQRRIINYYHFVVIFELLVSCILPLFVVGFSYVMTACYLVDRSPFLSEGTRNPQMKTRRNTAKTVVGLAFVFMISYVPYHVFWTYFIYIDKDSSVIYVPFILNSDHKFKYTYLISTIFLLINSCLNPVALFCTSFQFRQHLKRYLTCFCKTNSPPTDFELTRRN